jgi:hypothetical protein
MKLPANTIIPREKATDYLLIPQARGDKTAFLDRAGYTLANAEDGYSAEMFNASATRWPSSRSRNPQLKRFAKMKCAASGR